jgi:uncharacterized membrane protein YccC
MGMETSLFNPRGLGFAFNTMVAALAAVALSCWWELSNPGWAALSVFIASSQMAGASGAVTARAWYRFLGTAAGCAASLFLLPAISDTPELLVAALALWVTVCVYLALIDRSPGSYGFLLAGYTVCLVGLPIVTNGGSLWDGVLGRVEEIAVGVACAAIAHAVLFHRGTAPAARQKVGLLVAQARAALLAAFDARAAGAGHAERTRIAQGMAELHEITGTLHFDLVRGYRTSRVLQAIEAQLTAIALLLGAIEERRSALQRLQPGWPPLADYLRLVSIWIEAEEGGAAPTLPAMPLPGSLPPLQEALVVSLVQRCSEITDAWQVLSRLVRAFDQGAMPAGADLQSAPRSLHIDHGKALFAGAAVGVNVAIAAGAAILFGWQQAALVGIAAAGPANFAFMDDPRPAMKLFLACGLLAVPLAAVYTFAIFPAVEDLAGFLVVLAPLYFATALVMASPRYMLYGLGFALNSQTLLGLQLSRTGDFVAFSSLAIAVLLSSVISLVGMSIYRVIGAASSARRLQDLAKADLRDLVQAGRGERGKWASRMLDRIAMHIPRAGGAVDHPRVRGAFADARIGANLIELRDAAGGVPGLAHALESVAEYVGTRASHETLREDSEVIRALDTAIERMAADTDSTARIRALAAAAALRTGLVEPA